MDSRSVFPAIFMVIRIILATVCCLIAAVSLREIGVLNFTGWILLSSQFLVDGEGVVRIFKVKRIVLIPIILVYIVLSVP